MAAVYGGGCLSDLGYAPGELIRSIAVALGALIRETASALIARKNAKQLVANYKEQRDISRRMLVLAERSQQQLETVYWPREAQFLAEFSTPEALETVEVMGRRYAGRLIATVAGAFATQIKSTRCSMNRHCTSANKKLMQDLLMARAGAIANARVLGRNIAFAEYQAREDTNFERRAQAVQLGRGLIGQAANLYASAGAGLASIGNMLSGQLNSSLQAFGYAHQNFRDGLAGIGKAWDDMKNPATATQNTTMPRVGTGSATTQFGPFAGSYGYDSTIKMASDTNASNFFPELDIGSSLGLSERDQMNVWPSLQRENNTNTGKQLVDGSAI